jgi:hypothetical protein
VAHKSKDSFICVRKKEKIGGYTENIKNIHTCVATKKKNIESNRLLNAAMLSHFLCDSDLTSEVK